MSLDGERVRAIIALDQQAHALRSAARVILEASSVLRAGDLARDLQRQASLLLVLAAGVDGAVDQAEIDRGRRARRVVRRAA